MLVHIDNSNKLSLFVLFVCCSYRWRRFSKRRAHPVDPDGLQFLQSFINSAIDYAVRADIELCILCPTPFRISWTGLQQNRPTDPWEGPMSCLLFLKVDGLLCPTEPPHAFLSPSFAMCSKMHKITYARLNLD